MTSKTRNNENTSKIGFKSKEQRLSLFMKACNTVQCVASRLSRLKVYRPDVLFRLTWALYQ